MTAPRAVGVRAGFAKMPRAIHVWVADVLGSPVVDTQDMTGGMSPGCATRLLCADGRRVFVKAVGTQLNPDTPRLFRREEAVLSQLGSHPLWAGLLASYDDGDWIGLMLEDVEGTHPDFHNDDQLGDVLAATDHLAGALRTHDVVQHLDLVSVRDVFTTWATTLESLDQAPAEAPLPDWLRGTAGPWGALMRTLSAEPADRLVHWDIRVDNLIRRPTGDIVFVDWGMAAIGPDWVDPLLARLERVEEPWFDDSVRASPRLAVAGDERITGWLIGFAAHLAVRSVTADDINLPTASAFRRTESARLFAAAEESPVEWWGLRVNGEAT